jgi:hypothetical protein
MRDLGELSPARLLAEVDAQRSLADDLADRKVLAG